jgi:hypothetical protein
MRSSCEARAQDFSSDRFDRAIERWLEAPATPGGDEQGLAPR